MYSLRFDDGITSAGFLLTPRGLSSLALPDHADAATVWQTLVARYPTLATIFAESSPVMPIAFRPLIQHRLTRATGERWLLMPHAYAFVDPLFSTGIAWSLRAVERLALAFEGSSSRRGRIPDIAILVRYGAMLAAIDTSNAAMATHASSRTPVPVSVIASPSFCPMERLRRRFTPTLLRWTCSEQRTRSPERGRPGGSGSGAASRRSRSTVGPAALFRLDQSGDRAAQHRRACQP